MEVPAVSQGENYGIARLYAKRYILAIVFTKVSCCVLASGLFRTMFSSFIWINFIYSFFFTSDGQSKVHFKSRTVKAEQ